MIKSKLKESLTIFDNAKFVNYMDLVLKDSDDSIRMKIRAQKHNCFGKKYYIFDIAVIDKQTGDILSTDSILSTVFETIDQFIEFFSMSALSNGKHEIHKIEIENMQEFLLKDESNNIKNFIKERGYKIYEPMCEEIDVTNFDNPAQQLMELWLKNKYSKMRIKIIERYSYEEDRRVESIWIYDLSIQVTHNHVIGITDPEDNNMIKVIYGWGDECNNVINEIIRGVCSKYYLFQSHPSIAGIFECYKEREVI